MKIPGASRAVIDLRKLEEYALSFAHPRGRQKARVFRSVLSITTANIGEFEARIREALDAEEKDGFGARYTVDFQWTREGRSAAIRTSWIIRADEDFPRLTSCYVLSTFSL